MIREQDNIAIQETYLRHTYLSFLGVIKKPSLLLIPSVCFFGVKNCLVFSTFPYPVPVPKNCVIFIGWKFECRITCKSGWKTILVSKRVNRKLTGWRRTKTQGCASTAQDLASGDMLVLVS